MSADSDSLSGHLRGPRVYGPSEKKFRQILTRALLVPVGLLILLAGLLFFQVRHLVTAMQWLDHTDQAIAQANQIRFDLLGLQNSLRGFAIAGQESSRENYRTIERSLQRDIDIFKDTVSDNPRQLKRIDSLQPSLSRWKSFANQALAEHGSAMPPQALVRSGEGQKDMADLEVNVTLIVQAEDALRVQRSHAGQAEARRSLFIAVILTAFLGLALAYFSRRQLLELANVYRRSQETLSHYAAQEAVLAIEARYKQLVDSVKDYAIIMLDKDGKVQTWNSGAEKIKGYRPEEIIGKHFSIFYPPEDVARGKLERELETAVREGRLEDEDWRIRKDGSRYWANVIIIPLLDHLGNVTGYGKITRDLTERKRIEDEMRQSSIALSAANKELEAFSYAVSHDLRAPLRGIDGFSQAILEDYGDQLNDEARDYLKRVRAGVQKMGKLIDDLLNLSRLTRGKMRVEKVDLSRIAHEVVSELRERDPARNAEISIQEGLTTNGDAGLLSAALENLLSNAWKFSAKKQRSKIELGAIRKDGETVYFVRDNGAGFDMAYSDKLFGAFQRLHRTDEFQGTGVGLATVRRILLRHGGRIWAEAKEGEGATFYFTVNMPGQEVTEAA